jgi:hypothetical protein
VSGWFPRLSPSGRRVASGDTVIHVDGLSTGLPGTSPQWLNENTLLYTKQPSGGQQRLVLGGTPEPAGFDYNEWHAQNGRVVGWPAAHGLRGPTVSASGILAGIRDLGNAGELVVDGQVIDTGALFEPRFSGDALVWGKVERVEGVGDRRHTYGRRSPGAPTELLSVDMTQHEFWPIAIETPRGLFIVNHGPDRCFVRAWGATQVIWSYVGVTDRPDARWTGSAIRIVASERGQARDFTADPAAAPFVLYPPAPPPPPPLPDIPWQTDPNGVIEDIAPWLFSTNQGPDVHISPDGKVRFFCKSDEVSGDGPGARIGEWWDVDDQYIGHLDDASTGRRVWNGRAVTPDVLVAAGKADLWPTLPLSHNWFSDGARLWMPRRLVSGSVYRYKTDINWNSTTPERPNSTVWPGIPIEIRVDVGYGRYKGREVFARVAYVPDGNAEVNYYGPPNGQNAWIIAAGNSDPWGGH